MPLSGTADVAALADGAPLMPGLDTEPWRLEGAEILHLMFEIDDSDMGALIPPALHPTIPPVAVFSIARFPESPVGPFMLAQVRAGCRAGVRPRGFLLRAYSDSANACEALATRWGFAVEQGGVALRRYHDRITGDVRAGDREVLRMTLVDPQPISGGDVQYVASMQLARVAEDGEEEKLTLIQVDPEYTFHRAERGRPQIEAFEPEAWAAEGLRPVYPVHASFAQVDTGLPLIRYIMDPKLPALAGTRTVRHADSPARH
jgi:hypothetical protein